MSLLSEHYQHPEHATEAHKHVVHGAAVPAPCSSYKPACFRKKKIGACLHRLIGATYFRLCSEVLLCLIRPIVLHLTDNQQPHRLTYTLTKYSGIKIAH